MTIHTKAATDEIYEIFNAPLASAEQQTDEQSSEESEDDDDDDDDDDYTSGGESTCTGRISGATSEYGDETQGDLAAAKGKQDEQPQDTSNNTGWSEFTITRREADGVEEDETADESEHSEREEREDTEAQDEDLAEEGLTTPEVNTNENQRQAPHHIPMPPSGYNVPTRPYRDAQQAAYNRLPFMTPIVEKTESSIGTIASRHEKDYFSAKTPCPKTSQKTPTIPEGDDELWSSPFQEAIEQAKEMPKIPPPPTFTNPKPRLPATVAKPADNVKKGPIILDAQCNPMEESIHATILKEIHPPLTTYDGYFDHGDESFGRKPEIKKYCKANAKGRSNSDKTMSTVVMPPILKFPGSDRTYAIKRELGAGAYAPVYLIEHLDSSTASSTNDSDQAIAVSQMGKGSFGIARRPVEALKTEEPPSAWEFYILSTVHRRLGVSRAAASIIRAYEMHIYTDEGYLVEEYLEHGTLLDLVNTVVAQNAASGGGALDETLAMFFVVELLRTVEALHAKGIIHGDLKADNVMLRLNNNSTDEAELTAPYTPTGANNWCTTGISLIDFGRGIDMRAFTPAVQFIADWATTSTDCAEMRELRPWTYQADYHGIAAIAHTLLFGKYIDTVVEKGTGNALGGGSGGKRYKLKEGLKRWWQGEIWTEFFEVMLNSGQNTVGEEGGRLPVLKGMRRCREGMEAWLVENGERGVGLRGMLRRVEGSVGERGRRK